MADTTKNCPPVPGGPDNGGARGYNLRQKPGHHTQRQHLALATYNARTLRTDAKLIELKEALSRFLVRKALVNNIDVVRRVSSRVAYLILRISKRYSLKVIQVYAPTWTHPYDEVEAMYEEISTAIHSSTCHYTAMMGDFNAKLSRRCGDELNIKYQKAYLPSRLWRSKIKTLRAGETAQLTNETMSRQNAHQFDPK
ncbi:uncharacterized protein LOC123658694 [Melitaea cinxia]|uniref:uncharacterized protein LOC123658694 n=1 Tax=Melitaea cinxia TaxID=113334 RepID=UPI001E26F4A0|nr:uncharacterized protein LOC123658694 [Melitaea cinxia]